MRNNEFKEGDIIVIVNNRKVSKAMASICSYQKNEAAEDFLRRWPNGLIAKIFVDYRNERRIPELGEDSNKKYGLLNMWIKQLKMRHATDREKFLFILDGEVSFLLEKE